ncbi:proline racemase family protein [Virgibacillus kekensis]|uniref:Proline racemase family protein n=1 Tax=Virgibacillus kekensis TaxID=202261 RepID=A0ABV9DGL1_9BACI
MNIEKMFTTIDSHVAGEAFRMIIHSPLQYDFRDFQVKQSALHDQYEHEKLLLLNEPRGHRGVNGCIITPSSTSDYGLLFVNHGEEYRFSYSGIIATLTTLLETGNLAPNVNGSYQVETVNGIYTVYADFHNHVVENVRIESGKCKLISSKKTSYTVEVDNSRKYIISTLPDTIPTLQMRHLSAIVNWGKETLNDLQEESEVEGIILVETISDNETRSVTFEKDGAILRSPGIDSTFAIYTAWLDRYGEIHEFVNRSIFNSQLIASHQGESKFTLNTRAIITGEHQFIYDKSDPLERGFLLR